MTQIPEGFERHFRTSAVTDPWEPLYSRKVGDAIEIGLTLSEAHCNSRGLVHGGVIAALADNAMGLSYVTAIQNKGAEGKIGAVTLGLQVDYAAAAKLGQWLHIAPRVLKAGKSIGFIDALVQADEKIIARASATFKLLD